MSRALIPLSEMVAFLDHFFVIDQHDPDPAFSRHVPLVYDGIGFDWRSFFEPGFVARFNGLMLRGDDQVGKVWLLSFPEATTLSLILDRSQPGDLIFAHHPIDMRCGDPRGRKGEGFIPITPALLQALRDHRVSYYSCHAPLDVPPHPRFSPSGAIVNLIGGTRRETFFDGAGILCTVAPTTAEAIAAVCQAALRLPYLDWFGNPAAPVTRVAVLAGGAGDVRWYEHADRLGADLLIGGEITAKVDDEIGAQKQAAIERYQPTTRLTAIGLSHAGSEFLVMRELAPFLREQWQIEAEAIPEATWWR